MNSSPDSFIEGLGIGRSLERESELPAPGLPMPERRHHLVILKVPLDGTVEDRLEGKDDIDFLLKQVDAMSRITGVKAYLQYSVNLGTAPCDRQLGYQKIGNISNFGKKPQRMLQIRTID